MKRDKIDTRDINARGLIGELFLNDFRFILARPRTQRARIAAQFASFTHTHTHTHTHVYTQAYRVCACVRVRMVKMYYYIPIIAGVAPYRQFSDPSSATSLAPGTDCGSSLDLSNVERELAYASRKPAYSRRGQGHFLY